MRLNELVFRTPASSAINWFDWDNKTRELVVQFKNGSEYQYFNVHPRYIKGLISAISRGRYFYYNIRKNPWIQYRRVYESLTESQMDEVDQFVSSLANADYARH